MFTKVLEMFIYNIYLPIKSDQMIYSTIFVVIKNKHMMQFLGFPMDNCIILL